MKKKLLSLILAVVMSLGAFGALVGCDEETRLPNQGEQQQTPSGNQGSGQKPGEGSGQKPGESQGTEDDKDKDKDTDKDKDKDEDKDKEQEKDKDEDKDKEQEKDKEEEKEPSYKTGDKIEDEKVRNTLISSMQPQMKALEGHLNYNALFNYSGEMEGYKQTFELESDFLTNLDDKYADSETVQLLVLEDPENGTMVEEVYIASFLRGNTYYTKEVAQDATTVVTLEELKERYKDCTVVKREYEEDDEENVLPLIAPYFTTCVKLIGNIAIYSANDFFKTESGYALIVDPFGEEGLLSKLFKDGEAIFDAIDIDKVTVKMLFEQKQFNDILQTLLKGITAKEAYGIIDCFMTSNRAENEFPAAKEGQSAIDYFKELIDDKEFYHTLSGEEGTIGGLSIKNFLGYDDMTKEEIKELWEGNIDEMTPNVKARFEEEILDSLGMSDGEFTKEDVKINFLFDENKKFEKITFIYDADVNYSEEEAGFEGTIQITGEVLPKGETLTLRDMSKAKPERIKDCNVSKKCDLKSYYGDFEIEDAYTLTLIIADEKVTVKVESELYPELNYEKTVDLFSREHEDVNLFLSQEHFLEYLIAEGYDALIEDEHVYIREEGKDSMYEVARPSLYFFFSVDNGHINFGGDEEAYEFIDLLFQTLEFE